MLFAAPDTSWLKVPEVYLRLDVSNSAAPKRSVDGTKQEDTATRGTNVASQRQRGVQAHSGSVTTKQQKRVYGRISGLKGKFGESDLTQKISVGVNTLIEEIGVDNADEVVSVLDDLEQRGLFKLDEIAGELNSGNSRISEEDMVGKDSSARSSKAAGREHVRPSATEDKEVASELPPNPVSGDELYCTLNAIPKDTVLSRDIHTVDGRPFVKSGIDVTLLVASIITNLDSLGVLGLEKRVDDEFSGIYVKLTDKRPTDLGEPNSSDARITESLPATFAGSSKTVSVNEVEAGSILAHDIYTTDGRSYLPAGSEVTVRITTLLRDLCELGNISSELRIVG